MSNRKNCLWCSHFQSGVCHKDEVKNSIDVSVINYIDEKGESWEEYSETKFIPDDPSIFYCYYFE